MAQRRKPFRLGLAALCALTLLLAGCTAGEPAETAAPTPDSSDEPGAGAETTLGAGLELERTDRLVIRSLDVTAEGERELARAEITDAETAAELAGRWAAVSAAGSSRPMGSPRLELSFYAGEELLGRFLLDEAGMTAGESLGRGNFRVGETELYEELAALLPVEDAA